MSRTSSLTVEWKTGIRASPIARTTRGAVPLMGARVRFAFSVRSCTQYSTVPMKYSQSSSGSFVTSFPEQLKGRVDDRSPGAGALGPDDVSGG